VVIGLFAKIHRTDFSEQLAEVASWLESKHCEVLVDAEVYEKFQLDHLTCVPGEEIPARADSLIVFGGDGTMLSVARLVRDQTCPILGVNLGSLGFLTEVTLDRVYTDLQALLDGEYRIDRRCMLEASLRTSSGTSNTYQALNDVVINKAALARVISVDAYFDGQFIANFVADGIIISTPTGSTAYSLSAGGPIVYPTLESILVTPICPHTLTNRPLIIPPDYQIRFVLRSGEDVMLTIDGQLGVEFEEDDEVICTRSPFQVELIRPSKRGFFDTLREKLNWAKR
jgi:NAD+ kinase